MEERERGVTSAEMRSEESDMSALGGACEMTSRGASPSLQGGPEWRPGGNRSDLSIRNIVEKRFSLTCVSQTGYIHASSERVLKGSMPMAKKKATKKSAKKPAKKSKKKSARG